MKSVRLSQLLAVILLSPLVCAAQSAAEVYGEEAMAAARRNLEEVTGGQVFTFLQADRLEARGKEGMLWEAQGWIGSDYQRFWFKSDGEYFSPAGEFEHSEVQGLYSRAISPFFDFQAGVRQDFGAAPKRTHAVVGIQGLAPYLFEVDTALFLSHKGDVTARAEAEYQLFLTQRLILMPRAEVNLSLQDIPELQTGAGLSTAEAGARLRYEIRRQFAPYVGVSWTGTTGTTADFAKLDGRKTSDVQFVFGLRLWY